MKSIVDDKDFAIFAQAPVAEGFSEFWEMIYEKNVKSIVMLCNFDDPKRGVILIDILETSWTILAWAWENHERQTCGYVSWN